MKHLLLPLFILSVSTVCSQKKMLDHEVYDSWKSLGERIVSNNGNYIAYTVTPQEGDGVLYLTDQSLQYHFSIPRGYNAAFTEDSRFLVCKIKAPFAEIRKAKIQKKKTEDLPKDSLAILYLDSSVLKKIPAIKSYLIPERSSQFIAYLFESQSKKNEKKALSKDTPNSAKNTLLKMADSLIAKALDSIKNKIKPEKLSKIIEQTTQAIIRKAGDDGDGENENASASQKEASKDLAVFNTSDSSTRLFKNVSDYLFDKNGKYLLIKTIKSKKDSTDANRIILLDLFKKKEDTLLSNMEDAKGFVFDDSGNRLAFFAQSDLSSKITEKHFQLYLVELGERNMTSRLDRFTAGMPIHHSISEHSLLQFSKNGEHLFFGVAPLPSLKDTTLVDFETAKLDIWHYKDDYLQTQQLKNLENDQKSSILSVYHIRNKNLLPLGQEISDKSTLINEGDSKWVLLENTQGNRVESQWTGQSRTSAELVHLETGKRKAIYKNLYATASASPSGKFVYWYDKEKKQYFSYDVESDNILQLSKNIPTPLFEEENDLPDLPNAYGVMGWSSGDSLVFLYDRYDIWQVETSSPNRVINMSGNGRKNKLITRCILTDKEHRFFKRQQTYLFSTFKELDKTSSLFLLKNINQPEIKTLISYSEYTSTSRYSLSKNAATLVFSTENFEQAPNLHLVNLSANQKNILDAKCFTDINPQQANYQWGKASLFTWRAYSGKITNGIVYKPENFDSTKKYPLICYFYEKLSDGLHTYQAPAPTPSRLNIPFFVSRGYVVLAPDIHYRKGHPGSDAYDHVVSGARALVKKGFIDSTKIGIQGQSWGGYQVAYLITKTNLFAAAWAGAPVANMTSAYGGIRWESGLNRQFQYEKQQSRIGYNLWENQSLYLENSPLFHLKKVSTPLAIMHNDADGAVPWYQGIELFTALRRLQKPVWLLNYNGEAHNLMERRNRKDLQIREQQFFDWLLKGEPAPDWIEKGVPATEKGKDWGL